jgi:hypothetical protein
MSPAGVPAGVCLDPRDCMVMRTGRIIRRLGHWPGDRGMDLQQEPERTLGRLGQVGVGVRHGVARFVSVRSGRDRHRSGRGRRRALRGVALGGEVLIIGGDPGKVLAGVPRVLAGQVSPRRAEPQRASGQICGQCATSSWSST